MTPSLPQAKLKRQGLICDHVIITAVDTDTFSKEKRNRYLNEILLRINILLLLSAFRQYYYLALILVKRVVMNEPRYAAIQLILSLN